MNDPMHDYDEIPEGWDKIPWGEIRRRTWKAYTDFNRTSPWFSLLTHVCVAFQIYVVGYVVCQFIGVLHHITSM